MPTDAPPPGSPPRARWGASLARLERRLERPMLALSFAWLALFIVEFTRGLTPLLERIGWAIWAVFVVDFVLRLALARDRSDYLRANWLTALSLLVPAARLLRVLRVARVARLAGAVRGSRGLRLVKVIGSFNRGMRALGRSFRRRGFGYVVALTVFVTLAGAAGMYAFERDVPDSPIRSYGTAVWWTAMIVTTMGSDYFPQTVEGRALCVLLALFAFAVFGYVTATLATFFVGRDAQAPDAEVAGQASVDALAAEVRALRAELRSALRALPEAAGPTGHRDGEAPRSGAPTQTGRAPPTPGDRPASPLP